MNENCRPGAMIPESHPAALDVDVCDTESLFVHVTVEPAEMSRVSGLNARLPNISAPLGIVTAVAAPPGVGVGVGVGVGEGVGGDE